MPDLFAALAGLAALAFFCSYRLKLGAASFFAAVVATSLFPLPFAMAGHYALGRTVAACLSAVLCAAGLVGHKPRKEALRESLLNALVPCLLLLYALWHYAGGRIFYWDEFYWAAFVKELCLTDGFWTAHSPLPRLDSVLLYPPGVTLVHGLFQPRGGFSEPAMALGQTTLLIGATGVCLSLVRVRRTSVQALLYVLLCFCVLRAFGTQLVSDVLLFGYGEAMQTGLFVPLCLLCLVGKTDGRTFGLFTLSLALLVLTKPTGFVLAAFACGLFGLRLWLCSGDATEWAPFRRLRDPRAFVGAALRVAACAVPAAVLYVVWLVFRDAHVFGGHPGIFQSAIARPWTLDSFLVALRGYAWAFVFKPIFSIPRVLEGFYVTTQVPVFILCALGLWWLARKAKGGHVVAASESAHGSAPCSVPAPAVRETAGGLLENGFARCVTPAWIVFCWFVWVFAHACVSVTVFTPAELVRGAAFERYTPVVTAALVIVILAQIVQRLDEARGVPNGGEGRGHTLRGRAFAISATILLLALILLPRGSVVGPRARADIHASAPAMETVLRETESADTRSASHGGASPMEMDVIADLLLKRLPEGSSYVLVATRSTHELANAVACLVQPRLREGQVEDRPVFNAQYGANFAFNRGDVPADFRRRARERGIDYVLVWDLDAGFLKTKGAAFADALGLDDAARERLFTGAEKALPLLLDLRAWREGKSPAVTILPWRP